MINKNSAAIEYSLLTLIPSRVPPGALSRLPSSPTPLLLLSQPTRALAMNTALSSSKLSTGSQTLHGQSWTVQTYTSVVAPSSSFPALPHTRARTTTPSSPRKGTQSASTRPLSSPSPTTRERSESSASPTCPSGSTATFSPKTSSSSRMIPQAPRARPRTSPARKK